VPELLNPPVAFLGLGGMEKMAANLHLFTDLSVIHLWIEETGTGGSLFRRLYADFLTEAQEHLDHAALAPAAAKAGGPLAAVAEAIRSVAGTERQALEILSAV